MTSSDQRVGGQQRLLGQLALRRLQGRLAVLVAQAGRQLPQVLADRVPVLAQQDDAVLVVEGDDGDRARVVHDLPDAAPAAGHGDGVPAQRDDPALVDLLAVEHLELVRLRHAQMPTFSASSTGTGSRAASW